MNPVSKITDTQLMMLADGEIEPVEAAVLQRVAGADGAAKIANIHQVGDLVRGNLESAADDVEHRFGDLWTLVERRLEAESAASAPAVVRPSPVAADSQGLLGRLVRWVDSRRGYVLTSVLSAGAVAALAFVLRPEPRVEIRTLMAPIASQPLGALASDGGTYVLAATPPTVESIEVSGGTGTVFTIENEDGVSDTAMIWITPDDVLEGI